MLSGLTLSCHLLTGYLLLLALVLWVVVDPRPFLIRLWRTAAVAAGAVRPRPGCSSLRSWTRGRPGSTSVPAPSGWTRRGGPQVLRWLALGEFFDRGHAPLVTTLAGLGALLAVARWRRDEGGRAVVSFTALSLVLFAGRPTFGAVLGHLPGIDSVLLHRMIIGVHLGGLLLAGIGLAWLGRQTSRAAGMVLGRRAT